MQESHAFEAANSTLSTAASNAVAVTGGTLAGSEGSVYTFTGGSLAIDEAGKVTGTLTDSDGITTQLTMQMDPSANVMAGEGNATTEDEDGVFVFVRQSSGLTTGQLAGEWFLGGSDIQGGHTWDGLVTVNSSGAVTGGTLASSEGSVYTFTGGSLAIDGTGKITGTLTDSDGITTQLTMQMDPSANVMAGEGNATTEDEDGVFVFVRQSSGLTTEHLAGEWFLGGSDIQGGHTWDGLVIVTSTNDVPQFTSTPVTFVAEDAAYTYNITATDMDAGDTLTITGTSPEWLTLTDHGNGTATLSGTPTNDEMGEHAVELVVTDSEGATDSQSFTILVNNVKVSISDVRLDEGDSGTTDFVFVVTLSQASSHTVSVDYVTAIDLNDPNAATVVEDFSAWSGTLTIPIGQTSGTITVSVQGDTTSESDEQFYMLIQDATNATIIDGEGVGTILNDDASLRPDAVLVSGVPAYGWYYGCAPTSFGMIMGYWDAKGFDDLIPGDASSMTQAVKDTIASHQHITAGQENQPGGQDYQGYGDWHNSSTYPDHESNPDCIADFIQTLDSSSSTGMYTSGIENFVNYRGYTDWSVTQETGEDLTWSDLTDSIDDGLPLVFSVDSDGDGVVDHATTVIGYDATTQEYATFNTWYTTAVWYPFAPVQPGNVYGVDTAVYVIPNQVPTDVVLSNMTVLENEPESTVVGMLTTTYSWGSQGGVEYTLVSGQGSSDNSYFKIEGNELQTNEPFNYETKNSFEVRVRSTDQDGLSIERAIIVNVTDINESPIFTSTPVTSAMEGAVYIYNITATDVDAGDSLAITGNPPWLTLTDHGDGTATLTGTPTSNEVGDHAVELTVTDSQDATDVQSFTITVTASNSFCLDMDANGQEQPLGDGILIIRYMAGFTGQALIAGAVDPAGSRTDAEDIKNYLDQGRTYLDVDDDGVVNPLSDGILIIRYLAGFTGEALIAGAANPAGGRTSAEGIITHLDSLRFSQNNSSLNVEALAQEVPALEDRSSLLPSESPQLPDLAGMVNAGTTPEDIAGQIIFLDFDGSEGVVYSGPVTVGPFDVPAFEAPDGLAGQETAVISEVLSELDQTFAGTGITFTTQQPTQGIEYSTIYIGGDGSEFSEYGSFLGLAEQVDVKNQDASDNAFVFSDSLATMDADRAAFADGIASTIAHEVGHLLGYEHGDSSRIRHMRGGRRHRWIQRRVIVRRIRNTRWKRIDHRNMFTVHKSGLCENTSNDCAGWLHV